MLALFLSPVSFAGKARFAFGPSDPFVALSPLFFLPANVPLEAEGTGGAARWIRLTISHDRLCDLARHDIRFSPDMLQAGLTLAGTAVEPIMLRLAREAVAPGLASRTLMEALITATLIELIRVLHRPCEDESRRRLNADQLAVIRARIDTTGPLPTVAELARLCGMSVRTLLRLFRESTGESVANYARAIRCARAHEMLRESDRPLKVIAHQLGFSSHSSFTAAFRRQTGISPSDVRRSIDRDGQIIAG